MIVGLAVHNTRYYPGRFFDESEFHRNLSAHSLYPIVKRAARPMLGRPLTHVIKAFDDLELMDLLIRSTPYRSFFDPVLIEYFEQNIRPRLNRQELSELEALSKSMSQGIL